MNNSKPKTSETPSDEKQKTALDSFNLFYEEIPMTINSSKQTPVKAPSSPRLTRRSRIKD